MGIALLKKLNSNLPDPIKRAFAPVIRKKLIKNDTFLEQYKELEKADGLSEKEIEKLHFEKLRDTLVHAYKHTAYYKKLFDDIGFVPQNIASFSEIERIPLLTKTDLINHLEELQADDITDYYKATTGGSSGNTVTIYLDRKSIYREKAFIYHFWSKYGYDYNKSRLATFRGVEFNGKISKVNPLYNEILLNPFILNKDNLNKYLVKIKKFKADFIHGYPSAIVNFCRLLKQTGQPVPNIKKVFMISENCSDEQRKFIEETLKCEAVSFYGHSERAVFAEEVSRGYVFQPLYGYTELNEHSDGNIVCTGFVNRKTPLIRYSVDDMAEKRSDGSYNIIGHHTDVALLGLNGERITQTALNFHSDTFRSVAGYQLYQDKIGCAECRLLSEERLSEEQLCSIKKALAEKTGCCIDWKVYQVEALELTQRGKCKTIIQKLEKQN